MDNQERLKLLDKLHLCHMCEKARQAHNRKYCPSCIEKYSQYNSKNYSPVKAHEYQKRRREIYQEKKKQGICVRCLKPATNGLYCYEHSIAARRQSQKTAQIRRQQRLQRGLIPEYRLKHNLCCYCGKPVDSEKHGRACSQCAQKMAKASAKADKAKWKESISQWFEQSKRRRDRAGNSICKRQQAVYCEKTE